MFAYCPGGKQGPDRNGYGHCGCFSTFHDWQFPRLRRKLDPDVVPASRKKEEKLHWWPYLLAVGHDQEDTVQAFAHRHFPQLNYVLVAAS